MERGVNVNAVSESASAGDREAAVHPARAHPDPPNRGDRGPCLYLGPAGQRCHRPALEQGYCSKHQPGARAEHFRSELPRRAVAVLGLLAVIWPLLVDLVREILRLLR
jgi:hypothetical protein